MEVLNLTSFTFAYINGRINFPRHSLTYIVKGTFEFKPDQNAVIAGKQLFPSGDEFYPEDKEMAGAARYPNDFAYFKPRADILLVGKFHSPQEQKVYSSNVKFQFGSKTKILNVSGNRYWTGGFANNPMTNPEPFSELELRYENSFGGIDYKKNPVGKGLDKIEIKTGEKYIPVPNIIYKDEHVSSPSVRLEPAGFGPIGQTWVQRTSKLGSYKGNYMQERWPWFPKDFDWGYFNAAPPDMQINGYLKGDEKVFFENMHPIYTQYHSQLPGLTVRCFITVYGNNNPNDKSEENFKEIKMNLDTLWIDMENEKLVLVWRGVSDVQNEDFEEIKNIFIVSEKLGEQLKTVLYYKDLLEKELSEPEEEIIREKPVESDDEDKLKLEKELAEADEQMRASLIEAGLDPDNPVPSAEDREKEAEILKQLGIEDDIKTIPLTRKLFIERANRKESFEGEDLRGLDLSELDLNDLNFKNAILSGVSLKNSNIANSDFSGANLSNADLTGADLNNTLLKDADLTDAFLVKSNLTGALIEEAVFENAKMNSALLDEVKGKNAFFTGADLSEGSFVKADFPGADFSKSLLNKANFQGSNLSGASVEGASGIRTNLSMTDLTGLKASGKCNFSLASFQNSKGQESIWENADLTGSDFSFSEMEGANFSSAKLEGANLSASNMKFARFAKANLTNAVLTKMNLFQGSLEKANLTRTDFSGSNLYAVEFLDSIIKATRFTLANLKMTKLSNRNS